ncbi:hypothetical protein HS088_TW03G00414 [Tripterygium wilfordii]|uniref:B box-type domain-containing protein n=1 Tax=Tripterygium wilfordii TaxID=458696 RepID=A0A7J7DUN3_TRIWF|nr:uncharacterized protein LOC119995254 [Tripterygium wilfordii]KAF5750082.1 hypothetical protein HS088_TW03G00414 [Tripterygium wilfordii]
MVGCQNILIKKRKTDWLSTLLDSSFFDSCVDHQDHRKNEKNVFCIDCNIGFCKHCMTAHCRHRRLQICKYVYHDVVRLHDMQKHLDCSKIQTYKINGEKAVHLNPRPRLKDAKASTKAKTSASCEACGRYIQDIPNRFCSIACKVSVASANSNDGSQNSMINFSLSDFSWNQNYQSERASVDEFSQSCEEFSEESSSKPNKNKLHKRKGVPRRAPLS